MGGTKCSWVGLINPTQIKKQKIYIGIYIIIFGDLSSRPPKKKKCSQYN